MPKVPATEFKARCLELMDRVAERRESYVITKRGHAVAMLVPVAHEGDQPLFGRLRGTVEEVGDIVQPATTVLQRTATLREWDELDVAGPTRSTRSGRGTRKPGRIRH
jgi:prevent-host-death family protein